MTPHDEQKTVNAHSSAWHFVKCEKAGCMQKAGQRCITVGGKNPGAECPTHSGRVKAFMELWNAGDIDQNDERVVWTYYTYTDSYTQMRDWEAEQERIVQRAKYAGALTMVKSLMGEDDFMEKVAEILIEGGVDLSTWVPEYFK